MESSDLGVPIYLNQKIVFDLLAMMEDGFAEFRDVTTSSSESASRKHEIEASISASNVLQFIGLALKGSARRGTQRSNQADDQTSERRVHTPASLFYKLRSRLLDEEKSLIKSIERLEDLEQLSSGEFVEFSAILRKNPLVALLETIRAWIGIAAQIEALESGQAQQAEEQQAQEQLAAAVLGGLMGNPQSSVNSTQSNLSPEQQLAEQNPIYRMIKILENTLTEHGSLEITGELLGAPGVSAVLSTRFEGFEGGDASELIDGEFRVMGKVVRVIRSEGDGSINLLRKTPFGAIKDEQLEELAESFSSQQEGQEDIPLEIPEIRTRIEGPAILILPMAIFV